MGSFYSKLFNAYRRDGCVPKDNPISYVRSSDYTPAGHQQPGINDYWTLGLKSMIGTEAETRKLLFPLIQERLKDIAASQKLNAIRIEILLQRYPHWTEFDIYDFYNMFQIFDTNGTGCGEIELMNLSLKRLGDETADAARRAFLSQTDEDGTDTMDFEEFLVLQDNLRKEAESLGHPHTLAVTFGELKHRIQILYNMSAFQLIEAGYI